jgi:hypothetical protein
MHGNETGKKEAKLASKSILCKVQSITKESLFLVYKILWDASNYNIEDQIIE